MTQWCCHRTSCEPRGSKVVAPLISVVVVTWGPCCTGDYTVKFLVDGQWRLAPHWPTRDDAAGTTNNVLQVD